MEYDVLIKYIRPELLVLVVILYMIGKAIKNTKYIMDEFIPIILGILGIFLSAIYVLSVSPSPTTYQEILSLVFDIIVQGVCCAAAAVYSNQIGKQYNKIVESNKDGEA